MSATQPGADVPGFYAALGVQLPGWAHTEAPVRCFADPDAHKQHDRHPSCSVNVHSGAFHCHGCGAHGGAYDAALALGRSPQEAIELMITHRLTERRGGPNPVPRASHASAGPAQTSTRIPSPVAGLSKGLGASLLSCSGEDVRRWARTLSEDDGLLARLRAERAWEPETLRRLQIGFDGERITVPITDRGGALQGVLRLRIHAWQKPKVLAAPGSRLGLIPHPDLLTGSVVLVEGPSDMLAACSARLPALAVPGTHAWRAEWARSFAGREVTVVMDCDRPGRQAAERIAGELERHGAQARIVELAADRDDGYDLSDWLRAGNRPHLLVVGSREVSTRAAHADGDVWTSRIGAVVPSSRGAARPGTGFAGDVARAGNGRRSPPCAAS